jgi:hypothetical protein
MFGIQICFAHAYKGASHAIAAAGRLNLAMITFQKTPQIIPSLRQWHLQRVRNTEIAEGSSSRVWRRRRAPARGCRCSASDPALLGALSQAVLDDPHVINPAIDLGPGEVHLWWLRVAGPLEDGLLQSYEATLTTEELTECGSSSDCRSGTDGMLERERRALARGFMRRVLSKYLPPEAAPESIRLRRGPHGKPELEWPGGTATGLPLHFNATHTAGLLGESKRNKQCLKHFSKI